MIGKILRQTLLVGVSIGCGIALAEETNTAATKVKWSYVGNTGPQHWGMLSSEFELCDTGKSQSPIDIGRKKTRAPYELQINYENTPLFVAEDFPTELRVNKDEAVVTLEHALKVNIHAKKNKAMLTYQGKKYYLKEFHFHSPSENLWHKMGFPLEIHFVHEGEKGGLLVVGVFVNRGDDSKALQTILDHLPDEEGKEFAVKDTVINPNDLLPQDKRYYAFAGSLTTPPCTQGVQWLVMPNPITASPAQLLQIRQASDGSNARPIQPLNGRDLSYAVQS